MASRQLQKTVDDLVDAAARLEREAAAAEARLLAAFKRGEAKAFERIAALVTDPGFSSANVQTRLAWHFENLPSLALAQVNAGYTSAIESYLDAYPRIARLAEEVLAAAGRVPRDFVQIPQEVVDALQGRDRLFFSELNREALAKLDDVFLSQVVTGRTPAGALEALKGTITGSYPWGERRGLYEWHAGTYARTANMRFSREIMKQQADQLELKRFVFVGPVDSKLRPFCAETVGQVLTREEIEDLDNGQTGDVFVDGGGYNCRHTWAPTTEAIADELRGAQEDGETVVNDAAEKKFPKQPETAPTTEGPRTGKPAENPTDWTPAKSVADAEAWARDRNLAANVDFRGLALDAANELNRRVAAHMEAFPKLREMMDFLGSHTGRREYLRSLVHPKNLEKAKELFAQAKQGDEWAQIQIARYKVKTPEALAKKFTTKTLGSEKASGEYAAVWPGRTFVLGEQRVHVGRGLVLNEKGWFGTGTKTVRQSVKSDVPGLYKVENVKINKLDAWRRQVDQDVAGRWHPLGTNTIAGTVDHELGHALDVALGLPDGNWNFAISQHKDLSRLWLRIKTKAQMTEELSTYAAKNRMEFVAEAWSEFLGAGRDARPLAQEVGELILKLAERLR